jgi:hypothetical protein
MPPPIDVHHGRIHLCVLACVGSSGGSDVCVFVCVCQLRWLRLMRASVGVHHGRVHLRCAILSAAAAAAMMMILLCVCCVCQLRRLADAPRSMSIMDASI